MVDQVGCAAAMVQTAMIKRTGNILYFLMLFLMNIITLLIRQYGKEKCQRLTRN
jgi:hypothetical protein